MVANGIFSLLPQMPIEGAGRNVADAARKRENRQELRLALALRGGASMAVWIGGATAEINRVRTAVADAHSDHDASEHPWAALARIAGYDSLTVDVLAGASAGGLNATLLSTSIVYGLPFDRMRELWIRLADLEAMARPVPKLWDRRPESLLEGDDYFRAELVRAMAHLTPPLANATYLGDRADLLLTATLLDPVLERRFDGRAEPIVEPRRQGWFRFHHAGRPGDPLSDFAVGDGFGDTLMRLGTAARATSSFPAAFEPATIFSGPGTPPPGVPDMSGLFSDFSPPSGNGLFRVIDGGVLDNIPVTAAIQSVSAAPADRPTQRWLIYLNPEPFEHPDTPPKRLALPVAWTAMRARMRQESILADIEALDEHNVEVAQTALRRKALFAELRSTPPKQQPKALTRQADGVRTEHAVVRAELDAQAVHRLLTRPAGTEDGRLLPPIEVDPLAGWSAVVETRLAKRLSARLGKRAAEDPDAVFGDVRGFLAGVQECIDWVRDVERWAGESEARELGACKAALYRLRVFGEILEGHADRYWVLGAQLEPIVELSELDGWVDRVCRRRARLQHHLPSPIRPLLDAVLDVWHADDTAAGRYQRSLKDFASELLSIVESSGADAVVDSGITDADADHVDAVAEAAHALHDLAAKVANLVAPREHWSEPEQIGYGLLEQATDQQRPEVLREIVILTAPLDVGRAPGSHIEFLRVVSDAASPLPFEALRTAGLPLRTEDKIRGGDIDHFGAFLSAKWRANDWMWGRVDAATSLITLLLDPSRLLRFNDDPEKLASEIQAVVCTLGDGELGELGEQRTQQWQAFLASRWSAHADEVRRELHGLFERPDDAHPLSETRKLCVERLQWTIIGREMPFVAQTGMGTQPIIPGDAEVPQPATLEAGVRHYDVGRQRFADLGEHRRAGLTTRIGLIGYRAAKPDSYRIGSLLVRLGMTIAKPLLMFLAFAVAAPTRAALVAFLSATAVAFTGPGAVKVADLMENLSNAYLGHQPPEDTVAALRSAIGQVYGGNWWVIADLTGLGLGSYIPAALAVGFAVWLSWQLAGWLTSGGGVARWLPALVMTGLLVAGGYALLTVGFRLGAPGLAAVAVILTAVATFAYRPAGRLASVAVTAVAFTLALLICPPPNPAWVAVAAGISAYGQMLLLGCVDVLPPRLRPRKASRFAPSRSEESSATTISA